MIDLTGSMDWARLNLSGVFDWARSCHCYQQTMKGLSKLRINHVLWKWARFELTGVFDWARSDLTGRFDWARVEDAW